MVGLNEIGSTLNSNPYLTNDIKENFLELIGIFNKNFKNINLTNLNERLKTLKVIRGSKFLIRTSSFYDAISNELLLSLTKINDDIDCKHILMRELLNIITAKDNFTGFNKDNAYEALNIGYTEILANYLVGNEEKCEYEDEIIATNMIAKVVGSDILFKAYFTNDATLIMNQVC
ncbi:MAG: hypothetical protein RSB71_01130 [Bacilli bacterium]